MSPACPPPPPPDRNGKLSPYRWVEPEPGATSASPWPWVVFSVSLAALLFG